jgi:hypothetical protein
MSATGAGKGRWARHRSQLLKLSAAVLVAGAVFAVFREDWVFFILLFALLLEAALLFAAGKKGPEPGHKDLAWIVGGFAITSVFVAVVSLLYLANSLEYRLLGELKPIESIMALTQTYDGESSGQVFVSGVIAANNNHWGEQRCAVHTRNARGAAIGSLELLIDLKGGQTTVTRHLYYRNSQNQELRLAWPWQGIRGRRYLCLRIGDPISIRGYLEGARSLDGSRRSISILAEQIYPGSSQAHAAYLREHMPASTWLVFMARTSLLLLALFIGVFVNHLVKLIRLWRRRPDE